MNARDLARLYALMRPGERLAAVAVTRIGGETSVRMVLVRDGARRVTGGEDEQRRGAA